ncbi:nucleoside triphosphate pyrophosphohydrolase family protein [Flectobacillus longus]|uniref:nucleoside triphosphate pyrophosphohydrolase family protein n=1 Tax=Flectobacillus longus TaxID=2984207 RepID=UPI0024B76925|nr:nucleoside triphosphate pyrophosphohydrolase family protein [Flectobacillus longus]MDI9879732.1 nucleoside triphosphate pyrophosphohydrolase family protein [Flectobacillus longus]
MEKLDSLNQVAAFHKTFKAPILDTPQVPSEDRSKLRVSLIAEELKELEDGIRNNDIVEIADALCDIQYVLSGAVLEFGLGNKFVELFNEVQRSNMSKACQTIEEAEATVKFYFEKDGTEAFIEPDGDQYLVYRKIDNKILKSINYSPANLEAILSK